MREMPYEGSYDMNNRRGGGGSRGLLNEFREFLDYRNMRNIRNARNMRNAYNRGGGGSSNQSRNRIGYDTYDTYGRSPYENGQEEKMIRMFVENNYGGEGEHYDEREAREVVEEMYHIKDNKKFIGEKYDIHKAKEVCERYKEVLPDDVEVYDVYVAINAQYHDYAKLYENWFGGGNVDNKVFESAIVFWFKDVDFDGDKVWEYFHMSY